MNNIPFDAFFSVLIFLLGVPALLLQFAGAEVRDIAIKHWGRFMARIAVILVAAIAVIVMGLIAQAILSHVRPDETDNSNLSASIWIAVFFALLLIVALAARLLGSSRLNPRNFAIHTLKLEVVAHLPQQHTLNNDALDALIQVGKQSSPGSEKDQVLTSFREISEQVCNQATYSGDGLEPLLEKLVDVLARSAQPGSSQNFITAIELIDVITQSVAHTEAARNGQGDVHWSITALRELGKVALGHMDQVAEKDRVLWRTIQTLRLLSSQHQATVGQVSQAFYEIGIEAIRHRQVFVAMDVLDNLAQVAQLEPDADANMREETAANTYGLVAHFWEAGDTARNYVGRRLADLGMSSQPAMIEVLQRARDHHARRTQFQTADNLQKMINHYQHYDGDHTSLSAGSL